MEIDKILNMESNFIKTNLNYFDVVSLSNYVRVRKKFAFGQRSDSISLPVTSLQLPVYLHNFGEYIDP